MNSPIINSLQQTNTTKTKRLKNKIKYSVIICVYNEEKFIEKTLRSIRKESKNRKDIEVIVIDDASSDGTVGKVKKLGISKIFEISDNKGISACRNKGVSLAKGDYVIFLDGHIYLENDIFKIYDEYFSKLKEVDGITGVYHSLNKNDYNRIRDVVRAIYRYKRRKEFLIKNDDFTTISSCIFCVRKKIIKNNPFPTEFKGVAAEDTILQLSLMEKGFKFLHTNKVSVIHDANLSLGGIFRKIYYQSKGTHRLISYTAKLKIKQLPFSAFYLDFPLFTFLLFYLLFIVTIFSGFKIYFLLIFLGAIFLDFMNLKKLIEDKSFSFKIKLWTFLYILLNEGIKIFDWPLSIFREKYRLNDLIYATKVFLKWNKTKFINLFNKKNETRLS